MKILLTSPLPVDVKKTLSGSGIEVETGDGNIKKSDMIMLLKDKSGLICLLKDKIDKDVINSAPNLKIVANYAVGYDNIDIAHAKRKGIFVSNTPDVLTDATADLAFALLISAARRISEADRYVRKGNFKGWRPDEMLGCDLSGSVLGIFGFGRIGKALAKRAEGFKMKIMYCDTAECDNNSYKKVGFSTLIKESDFISLNASLNEENRHAFTMNEFKQMKRNAIIVNTARGALIKEDDLAEALEKNLIRGAGLDVYEFEPEINKRLLNLENVTLAPHMGSATEETRRRMAEICIEAVKSVLLFQKRPETCVN